MTFRVKKRGKVYRLEGRAGERAKRGTSERKRVRLSLGTMNGDAAQTLHSKIERALSGGSDSRLWPELQAVLPPETFEKLAAICGHVPNQASRHTWEDLKPKFSAWMSHRIALGKLRESTRERYLQTEASFGKFLKERGISELALIGRPVIEDYKAWRLKNVLEKKFSRGGRGVVLDVAVLHRIFAYAVECEMVTKNPVRPEGRPGDQSEHGAQPFKAAELAKLRDAAGPDLLLFLLLRWTGMRGSDAVGLRWEEIDWESREINRLTLKRRKRVLLPIHQELFFALELQRDHLKPKPEDHVLLNPGTSTSAWWRSDVAQACSTLTPTASVIRSRWIS